MPFTTHNFFRKSNLAPERLPCEVVERVGEEGEHEDADDVVVEWVVVAEAWDGAIGGGFVELDAHAEQAHDAAGGDETGGVEAAWGDFFRGKFVAGDGVGEAMLFHSAIDHPAHDSAYEDGEGGGDAEVGSDCEGEGADAEQFDDDDDGDAEENESPREFAAEDSVDDGGHETALRGRGFFAADALDPLDFDFAGGRVVEVFAVVEGGGADGVKKDVIVGVIDLCLVAVTVGVVCGEGDAVAG